MARRRFISNGIWTNPKFVSCSIPARLLFIGLVSHADDEGRLGGHPVEVGLQVFPADRMKAEKVDGFLQELADVDLVLRYAVEGRQLIEIPKFQDHQDSRYRVPSQLPSFQQSGGIRRSRQQVKDEVDVEVKALDLKIGQENYPVERQSPPPDLCSLAPAKNGNRQNLIRLVFEFWAYWMERPHSKLTEDRRRRIQTRLTEGYPPLKIVQAIVGLSNSPFHRGENDRGKVYDDLELICRGGAKLEQFIDLSTEEKAREAVGRFRRDRTGPAA